MAVTPQQRFTRYVALGDSLTEGKGDVYPDGALRGFADLLAHTLRTTEASVAYANLARPSVRSREICQHQVEHAAELRPDLVTLVAGVNDVIALRFHSRQVTRDIEELFARARDRMPDATLVTALLPDLSHVSLVARLWSGRVQVLNEAVRSAAREHGLLLVDLWDDLPMERGELALDRIHPSPAGHLRFARRFALTLGLPEPDADYLAARPRAERLLRVYRTAVVAPRFITKRVARDRLIAAQPAKRPVLHPIEPGGAVAPPGPGRPLEPDAGPAHP